MVISSDGCWLPDKESAGVGVCQFGGATACSAVCPRHGQMDSRASWSALAAMGAFYLFYCVYLTLPQLTPAGNRHARAMLARTRAGDSDVQFALGKAINEGRFGLVVSDIDPAQRWYQQVAD